MKRLTESDDLGNWSLKGVPWKSLYVGQVITRDIHDRIYGALYRLMEYEDIGLSTEDVEMVQYILADIAEKLEKLDGETSLVGQIRELLKKFN